jgi:hypothetical protein
MKIATIFSTFPAGWPDKSVDPELDVVDRDAADTGILVTSRSQLEPTDEFID